MRNGSRRAGRPGVRDNAWLAARLEEIAELLEVQGANAFRVRAYRHAAEVLRTLTTPAEEVLHTRGLPGLRELEGVGESLARTLEQLLCTGRHPLLERLRGESGPEDTLATVAGIGHELAHRIHDLLGVDSLYALEAAANDGRLEHVPGMGPARVRAVREALAGRFQRRDGWYGAPGRAQGAVGAPPDEPPVAELLDIDREYRAGAAAGTLARIAPRRFNPEHEAWLPVLHAVRGERHYTALYSNTARAHELGATHDWVVIYRDDHDGRGQWTVVTARRGPDAGQRVVRGREAECRALR